MTRYFFDIHGRDRFADEDGEELVDDAMAGRNAVLIASELAPQLVDEIWAGSPLKIEIRTARGLVGSVITSASKP